MEFEDINIGKIIKEKMEEKNISAVTLAKLIHCQRQNIYNIIKRKSIDIDLLRKISVALNYDFITEVYAKPHTNLQATFIVKVINGNDICISQTNEKDQNNV